MFKQIFLIIYLYVFLIGCATQNETNPIIHLKIVNGDGGPGTITTHGTAFLTQYQQKTYLITAHHTLKNKTGNIKIYTNQGLHKITFGQHFIDEHHDIHIIEILSQLPHIPTLSLIEGDVTLHAQITITGYPHGALTTTTLNANIIQMQYQIDGEIKQGMSGAPVLNKDGCVIAIVHGILITTTDTEQTINGAIRSINKQILKSILEKP